MLPCGTGCHPYRLGKPKGATPTFSPRKIFFPWAQGDSASLPPRSKITRGLSWPPVGRKKNLLPFSAAGFMIPLRKKRSPIQEGRCLLLGDAAGLADPFTGEGIYPAIRSAQIAASVLPEALKNGWNSLKPYQEAVDWELMPELECSRLFRELFNLRPSFPPKNRLRRPLVECHGKNHEGRKDLSGREKEAETHRRLAAKDGEMIMPEGARRRALGAGLKKRGLGVRCMKQDKGLSVAYYAVREHSVFRLAPRSCRPSEAIFMARQGGER